MSILTTRGEHLRSDLQAGSGAVSGRKLLTAREVLTSSLHEPYSHGSEVDYLRESTSESQRPVFIIHMHVPKTAGQSFALDMRGKNSVWAQKLANATRNIAAMKSDVHNFTAENTRKPTNVSHVWSNQSGMNLTIDDRDGKFPVGTDVYRSNQSEMDQTVDELDDQFEVAADLFEALAEGEGLNSTSIEVAPVYQALSFSAMTSQRRRCRSSPSDRRHHGMKLCANQSDGIATTATSQKMNMVSKEACLEQLFNTTDNNTFFGTSKNNDTFLATLMREPVAHVQSMYEKCKHNWRHTKLLVREKSSLRNISGWVQHYISDPTDNWSCYNPANMQTRAFSCNRDLWHAYTDDGEHTFELAKKKMEMFDFVGISERYHESLCVFSAVVTSRAPSWCNCSNPEEWAAHTGTHHRSLTAKHNPTYTVSDLTETEREAIQTLTSEDDKLYKYATKRFDAQIAKYEAQGILKLSC